MNIYVSSIIYFNNVFSLKNNERKRERKWKIFTTGLRTMVWVPLYIKQNEIDQSFNAKAMTLFDTIKEH